jgi:hypothetical protein
MYPAIRAAVVAARWVIDVFAAFQHTSGIVLVHPVEHGL